MSPRNDESILVVPNSEFVKIGKFQGFEPDYEKYADALIGNAFFCQRRYVETNPRYKQLIPYVILMYDNMVFEYRRGKATAEHRLRSLWSIGIGGHVNEQDPSSKPYWGTITNSMWRELYEEVDIQCDGVPMIAGLVNDDSNDVGRVHLGIVVHFILDRPEVQPREDGISESRFITIPEAKKSRDRYETWSQFCLDAITVTDV